MIASSFSLPLGFQYAGWAASLILIAWTIMRTRGSGKVLGGGLLRGGSISSTLETAQMALEVQKERINQQDTEIAMLKHRITRQDAELAELRSMVNSDKKVDELSALVIAQHKRVMEALAAK